MTLSALRTMLTRFTQMDLDNYAGESPTSSELTAQINWAIRQFASETYCCFDPSISFTIVASTATYGLRSSSFGKRVLEPVHVIVNDVKLAAPDGSYGLWTLEELERLHPYWRLSGEGQPGKAVWLPGEKLMLYQTPDGAYTGNNFVSGWYIPADLTDGTDDNTEPDIPVEFHEVLAYMASVKAAKPTATESEAWQRLAAYDKDAMDKIRELKRRNRSRFAGSFTRGQGADWLRSRVVW